MSVLTQLLLSFTENLASLCFPWEELGSCFLKYCTFYANKWWALAERQACWCGQRAMMWTVSLFLFWSREEECATAWLVCVRVAFTLLLSGSLGRIVQCQLEWFAIIVRKNLKRLSICDCEFVFSWNKITVLILGIEMAQWLRELSALAEYAGSDPSTHMVTQDSNSAPGLLESQTVNFITLTAEV